MGLDDDFAADVAAAGAAGDLRDQLERPLARPEVRHGEPEVRIDDADQRDVRKVQPLRDHLGPDQDIELAAPEPLENHLVVVRAAHRVGIHAGDPGRVEHGARDRLDLLGAESGVADLRRTALRAGRVGGNHAAAQVAAQDLMQLRIGVGHRTIRTARLEAALLADHDPRIAAPVQEEDALLAAVHPVPHRLDQHRGEKRAFARLRRPVPPLVDDADMRRQLVVHLRRHAGQQKFAGLCVVCALGGRGRGAEDHGRSLELAAHDRHVPRRVARRLRLLVARLVFLVDDDEPEVPERREECRPRPYRDLHLAVVDPVPLVEPFPVRQAAVQDAEFVAEPGPEAAHGLRRQRNLRHQHDRGLPECKRHRDGLKVHLGFSGVGHAEQQQDVARRFAAQHFGDEFERLLLILRRFERFARNDLAVAEDIAPDQLLDCSDHSLADQRLQ